MKALTGITLLLILSLQSGAQFFYQDIIVPRYTMQKWKAYRENKVKFVSLASFESNGEPTPGFDCNQQVSADFLVINTFTQTSMSTPGNLIASYDNKGLLLKTVDTSDTYKSTTEYSYDEAGRVILIRNTSIQTDNQVKNEESHQWSYGPDGKPTGMVKIKNATDTTLVSFVLDAHGNITEEHPVSHRLSLPVIYYYYDSTNSLTDVVRFNERANRLLPDYVFEKDSRGRLKSMLYLPPGTGDYQKWIYEYNDNGLEKRESCYNKRNELMGKIEYVYELH